MKKLFSLLLIVTCLTFSSYLFTDNTFAASCQSDADCQKGGYTPDCGTPIGPGTCSIFAISCNMSSHTCYTNCTPVCSGLSSGTLSCTTCNNTTQCSQNLCKYECEPQSVGFCPPNYTTQSGACASGGFCCKPPPVSNSPFPTQPPVHYPTSTPPPTPIPTVPVSTVAPSIRPSPTPNICTAPGPVTNVRVTCPYCQ